MSANRRRFAPSVRACWLCGRFTAPAHLKLATAQRHPICRDCWAQKVYQLANWFLEPLPPAQRLSLLTMYGQEQPRAQA